MTFDALFVYYRVPSHRAGEAMAAVRQVQQRLRAQYPGLTARLLCRQDGEAPGAAGGAQATWMEVYEHPLGVSQACRDSLQALIAALPAGLLGERHVEVFCPLADVPTTPAGAC